MMNSFRRRARLRTVLLAALLIAPAGCAVLGVAASALPSPPIKPRVVLANNSVGVMVWADRAIRVSWPTLQRDVGARIQYNLKTAQDDKDHKEMLNVTFPYPAESFVRWQRDHPGFDAAPITDIAPRLHVQRLIYVEFDAFDTRSPNSVALYRGSAQATLKVYAVPAGATVASELYQEKISVTYPKASTEDGRPDSSDAAMYNGTFGLLADEIAKRFVEHPAEVN